MPESEDRQVESIVESCMRKKGKTKKQCTDMAYAIVSSQKEQEKSKWINKRKKKYKK